MKKVHRYNWFGLPGRSRDVCWMLMFWSPRPNVHSCWHEHVHSVMIGYWTGIHLQELLSLKSPQCQRRKVLLVEALGLHIIPSGIEHEYLLVHVPSLIHWGQKRMPKYFHECFTGQNVKLQTNFWSFLRSFLLTSSLIFLPSCRRAVFNRLRKPGLEPLGRSLMNWMSGFLLGFCRGSRMDMYSLS